MAAHNFLGSAAGSSTASAVLIGVGEASVQYVLDPAALWRLDVGPGGRFVINRKISSSYTALAGGSLSVDDLRSLWLGLSNIVG